MMPWLSGFLFNPALAAGTAAIASPILIHILSRRRFRRIRWAAMEFLLDATRRNRRRVRLEQLILLALRCLAIILMAMMIARPFIRPGLAASLIGAAARTERIILIDDSFSMAYRPTSGQGAGGEPVFAAATEAAERIARWIAGEVGGDSLTVLLTSDPQRPSLALPSLSEANLRILHEHLETLSTSHRPARMADAIVAVAELVRRAPIQANTAVYVISDYQRRDWIRPASPDEEKPRSVIAPLAELADEQDRVRLALVDVGADVAPNAAITRLEAVQPRIVAGVPARYLVSVANFSPNALSDVELSVSIARQASAHDDETAVESGAVRALPPVLIPRIQAGQVVREPIEVTFPIDASDFLRVELAGRTAAADGLPLDNRRIAAVDVVPAVRVLIVNGEPSNDPYRDEVFLLRTALRPRGRVASGNDITVIDEGELEAVELDEYHCIVLANAAGFTEPARRNVEQFVRDGGGLIIFAGDQIDPDEYNRLLYGGGQGLLPARLTQVVEAPRTTDPVTFRDWDLGQPMLRAFVDELATILRQVRVYRFMGLDESTLAGPSSTSRPAGPSIADAPDSAAGPSESTGPEDGGDGPRRGVGAVLARFSDPARSAAMVRRPFGRGSVLLITTSVDQEWNDWAGNFSFVPMMLEIVQHMAHRSAAPTQVPVGDAITCEFDPARFRPEAAVRSPSFPLVPEITVPAVSSDDTEAFVSWEDTSKAGLYRFVFSATTGEPVVRYAAVNPDSAESQLARVGGAELSDVLIEMEFDYIRDLSIFQGASAGARHELWWPLLICVIAVLMLEHTLAWWFGTRG